MARDRRKRLTADQVHTIRSVYAAGGVSMLKLAERFGVAKGTIQDVLEGNTWRKLLPKTSGMFWIRED